MNDERLYAFINSVNFIANTAYKDRKAYENYRRNHEFPDDSSVEDLEILSILDKLGYPMNEVGTYLYKELILHVLKFLQGNSVRGEILSEEEIKVQLRNPFSQLFLDVARNDMDLGIKTFHAAVIQASTCIDYESNDKKLLKQIFEGNFNFMNYSLNALTIAKYYFESREFHMNEKNLNRVLEAK